MPVPAFSFARSLFAGAFCLWGAACSEPDPAAFVVYDSRSGPVRGWSHIVTQPEAFPLLASEKSKYAVDLRSMVADGSAAVPSIFRTVLARKMSDWGQQHANGIEPVFFDRPMLVGEVQSVIIRLKLNTEDSSIPALGQLLEHYEGILANEEVESLDNGRPCLGLAFVGEGYGDQGVESLKAVYSLVFDPASDFDKWMEVEVPLLDFTFGFEKDYSLREVARSKVFERRFVGFRIAAETTGGGVARNILGERWEESVPELYKELSVSLERIETITTKIAE